MSPSPFRRAKIPPRLTCIVATIWDLAGPAETTQGRATDQEVGGSNPSERATLGVYAHSVEESDREAADALGALLKPGGLDERGEG